MAFPRRDQGFEMWLSDVHAYNSRPLSYHDDIDNNHDMRGNVYWGAPAPFEPSPAKWRIKQKKKMYSEMKVYYKQGETSRKTKASNPPNQKASNRPQSSKDAAVSTPPHKKVKAEEKKETKPPSEKPNVVNSSGELGDASMPFSCNLCQYQTLDEKEIQNHFYSALHREVLQHLYIFFPKQRVDFLHEYLLFKKRKMAMQKKSRNIRPVKDVLAGIGQSNCLCRVQATKCWACDVLIADDTELVTAHIKSEDHVKNLKLVVKKAKDNSRAAAKELLVNTEVLEMLAKFSKKQNPFKELACSSQGSSTNEILVAEEDDDDYDEDDDDDDIFEDNDDDPIADVKADQNVPINHNEGPANENKDSKMCPDNESGVIKPEAPSKAVSSPALTDEMEDEEAAEAP